MKPLAALPLQRNMVVPGHGAWCCMMQAHVGAGAHAQAYAGHVPPRLGESSQYCVSLLQKTLLHCWSGGVPASTKQLAPGASTPASAEPVFCPPSTAPTTTSPWWHPIARAARAASKAKRGAVMQSEWPAPGGFVIRNQSRSPAAWTRAAIGERA